MTVHLFDTQPFLKCAETQYKIAREDTQKIATQEVFHVWNRRGTQ